MADIIHKIFGQKHSSKHSDSSKGEGEGYSKHQAEFCKYPSFCRVFFDNKMSQRRSGECLFFNLCRQSKFVPWQSIFYTDQFSFNQSILLWPCRPFVCTERLILRNIYGGLKVKVIFSCLCIFEYLVFNKKIKHYVFYSSLCHLQ